MGPHMWHAQRNTLTVVQARAISMLDIESAVSCTIRFPICTAYCHSSCSFFGGGEEGGGVIIQRPYTTQISHLAPHPSKPLLPQPKPKHTHHTHLTARQVQPVNSLAQRYERDDSHNPVKHGWPAQGVLECGPVGARRDKRVALPADLIVQHRGQGDCGEIGVVKHGVAAGTLE